MRGQPKMSQKGNPGAAVRRLQLPEPAGSLAVILACKTAFGVHDLENSVVSVFKGYAACRFSTTLPCKWPLLYDDGKRSAHATEVKALQAVVNKLHTHIQVNNKARSVLH